MAVRVDELLAALAPIMQRQDTYRGPANRGQARRQARREQRRVPQAQGSKKVINYTEPLIIVGDVPQRPSRPETLPQGKEGTGSNYPVNPKPPNTPTCLLYTSPSPRD